MDTQKIELSIIADDVIDLLQLILSMRTHESSGYLALALSPLIGFVSEESHKYLLEQGLLTHDPSLFKSFALTVTKLRALLKLFDDTDGGKTGLASTLALFQLKSAQWMDVGKNERQRLLSSTRQPDLGIYFINGELLYPSIVGFSTVGLTRQQIEHLRDQDFASISQSAFDFSKAAGEFLAQTIGVIEKHVVLQRSITPYTFRLSPPITHNDFFSKQIYAEVASRAQLANDEDAILLLYVLSQVNVAHILLPLILPKQSNLLFRLRFLTAYHATAALSQLQTTTTYPGLTALQKSIQSLPTLPNEKKVRNVLAHYGFGEGQKFLITNSPALDQIVEGFSGQDRSALEKMILQKLTMISDWTRTNVSKQSLSNFRAIYGDHT